MAFIKGNFPVPQYPRKSSKSTDQTIIPHITSVSLCSLALILLLQVHQDEATVPILIGTTPIIALTAAQVTGVAALAILTKLGAAFTGGLLVSRGNRRYRRALQEEELELEVTLKMLAEMEPEHCYKRIICAANTGKYFNQKLDGIMSLISEKSSDPLAIKFLEAAQYGDLARDVGKCEYRYQCSMDMDFIQKYF